MQATPIDEFSMDDIKKERVYFEDVKTKHTTHWDLDYLSQAELDRLYRKNRLKSGLVGRRLSQDSGSAERPSGNSRRKMLLVVFTGSTAALLALLLVLLFR